MTLQEQPFGCNALKPATDDFGLEVEFLLEPDERNHEFAGIDVAGDAVGWTGNPLP